jgi:serine/threonine protein kinase
MIVPFAEHTISMFIEIGRRKKADMDGLIGQTIGPYRIVEKIGEGGMAVVYKGFQESLNRFVAIKVLRSELAQDEQFVTRFRREALAVAELSHPNILHVYDAGVAFGMYYIVMAYVDGGSLKDMIAQGPVEMEYAISLAAQLSDALDHAHRHGLVHRDVKPNNVLITRDGRPLLTDFGIAKALHESQGLTRTGTAIGTPEYMAPEQIQGQAVDGRTDIYAMGIVLYEMLVGWAPFSTTTPVATLYRQVNEPPPPLRQANINVPAWLEAIVLKALAKRPQDRYQHAGELAQALREHGKSEKARTVTPAPVQVPSPRPEKLPASSARRANPVPILIGAIAILLIALVAVGIVLLNGGTGQSADATPKIVTITRVITPTPQELTNLPAPILVAPIADDKLSAQAHFEWRWDGPALNETQAFELHIWSKEEEDAQSSTQRATAPTTQTAVDLDLQTVPTVQKFGPTTYFWTVIVVDTNTGSVLSAAGEKRSFAYVGP